ncbi:hypothetical protein PMIN02_000834 [Paraphaeosphaeria minitans]
MIAPILPRAYSYPTPTTAISSFRKSTIRKCLMDPLTPRSAGLLEYQGTVYNIEPGICVNNGGTWMAENPPGGCDIPIEAAIHADLSTAVVDSIAARDAHGELAALDNIEHAHFLENLGILTLVVWALCFLMWLWGFFKFVQSKRRAQAGWEKLVRTAGMNVVGKDVNNEGEMVDGIHDKTIEKVNALSHDSQLRLEDV